MNNIHSLLIIFLLVIFYFLNICNALPKYKQKKENNRSNSNNIFRKKNSKNNFRRQLQDGTDDYPFVNLSIYIDTAEFNETFPRE